MSEPPTLISRRTFCYRGDQVIAAERRHWANGDFTPPDWRKGVTTEFSLVLAKSWLSVLLRARAEVVFILDDAGWLARSSWLALPLFVDEPDGDFQIGERHHASPRSVRVWENDRRSARKALAEEV